MQREWAASQSLNLLGGLLIKEVRLRIPREYIETVRSRVSILDVVSKYCDLTQKGKNWVSSCPFPDHIDKDPSFSVRPDMGIFKCFGCGVGGDMFSFLCKLEGMTYPEAVKYCAELGKLEFPYSTEGDNSRDQLYALLKDSSSHYYQTLLNQPNKLSYLTQQRGLTMGTIQTYGLGYCDGSYLSEAVAVYDSDTLLDSGLFWENDFNLQETLLDRWVFPIVSLSGHVLAFGGNSTTEDPKYRNTSDSDVYNKSHVLYGLYQAKQHIRNMKFAVLVEGYFDVLSVAQGGFPNTVGVCGTAFTPAQARLLKRLTNKVVIFTDNDQAGLKAVHSIFATLFNAGIDFISVAFPPAGKDPDDLFKMDKASGQKALMAATNYLDWMLPNTLIGEQREKRIVGIRKIIALVSDPHRRKMLTGFCANRLGVTEQVLAVYSQPHRYRVKEDIAGNRNEHLLLAAVVRTYPTDEQRKQLKKLKYSDDIISWMLEHIIDLHENTQSITEALFDNLTPEQAQLASEVVSLSETELDLSSLLRMSLYDIKRREIEENQKEAAKRDAEGKHAGDLLDRNWQLLQEI